MNYGSPNSTSQLVGAQLQETTDTDFLIVPYKGDAPTSNDLLAGQVDLMLTAATSLMQQVEAGRLNLLGVVSSKRSGLAPDVPTFVEAGLTGVSVTPWVALVGPAGLPDSVTNRVANALNNALKQPEIAKQLSDMGTNPETMSPSELKEFIENQLHIWQDLVRKAGLAPE